MSLQGFDLRDVVLLLLLELLNHELGSSHILFIVHTFLIEFIVVVCHLFDALLMSFGLNTDISIVLEYILLFHLEGSHALLRKPLLILELLILPFKELVCLSCLGEFTIDKLVLTSEGLNIFSELS